MGSFLSTISLTAAVPFLLDLAVAPFVNPLQARVTLTARRRFSHGKNF